MMEWREEHESERLGEGRIQLEGTERERARACTRRRVSKFSPDHAVRATMRARIERSFKDRQEVNQHRARGRPIRSELEGAAEVARDSGHLVARLEQRQSPVQAGWILYVNGEVAGAPMPDGADIPGKTVVEFDGVGIDFHIREQKVLSRLHFHGDKILQALKGDVQVQRFDLDVAAESHAGGLERLEEIPDAGGWAGGENGASRPLPGPLRADTAERQRCEFTGLKHAKLYHLLQAGGPVREKVRVADLRTPGTPRGQTLHHVGHMLRYLDELAGEQAES